MKNETLINQYKKDLKSDLIKNSRMQFQGDKTYEDFVSLVKELEVKLTNLQDEKRLAEARSVKEAEEEARAEKAIENLK